jgi:hypothetical protein
MTAGTQSALTYLKLSEWFNRKGQPQQRDRFLVLAADAAHAAGRQQDAEKLRQRLLKHNPHHLLRPYASFSQAMDSVDVQSYVNDLRNSYPPKKAAEMLTAASEENVQPTEHPKPLPPTLPVVDLDADPAGHAAHEPLKVYRVQEGGAPVPRTSVHGPGGRARTTMPSALAGAQPPAAVARTTAARPPKPVRPAVAPPVYSLAPEQNAQPNAWKQLRRSEVGTDGAGGEWVGTVLFGVVLAIGAAMSAYALAGPLLLGR